ncbi:hypothetical protein DAEQUDRAFT_741171 [Daedalea quercina L-15889]|uniref:Uncharacterized protein n=1 Tax=Daedalea quercina L-15889 TaxID=1314783 RepID=A0A165LMY7_9APHY|nr:hypothetical protein DAEQUDRAFT_741171 [Daedalea quercina L-15889]
MHAVSGTAQKKLADTTHANAPVRSHGPKPLTMLSDKPRAVSSASTSSVGSISRTSQKTAKGPSASSSSISKGKSSYADRVLNIAKSTVGHPKAHSDVASIGSKRPRSPSHSDAAAHFKAQKTSRASDASSSSKIPPLLPLQSDPESSDADALPLPSKVAATLLPKPRTHCTTCHSPLGPHSRFKNCDACREKHRVYQRQRKERMDGKVASLLSSVSIPASMSSVAPARRASSPENDMMRVDGPSAVIRPPPANVRCVWDEVPEFQTEDDFLAAVRRSVLAWREHANLAIRAGTLTDFEFCGGYAVVAGGAKVDEATVRRLSGKLVLQGVPMTKQPCFKRLTKGGPATKAAAYHVFDNLSTVFYCQCKDGGAGQSVQRENVCRGRIKLVVETTNEKSEIGVFGQNIVVETSHAFSL